MRTVLTVLLTSLAWAFVIACFFELREPTEAESAEPTTVVEQPATPAPTSKREQRAAKKAERAEQKAAKKAEKAEEAEKTEEATPAPAPAPAELPASQSIDYAREIIGQWTPVEGSQYPLEISKYGCAIQTKYGVKMRYRYAIKGKRIDIGYDSNAKFEITKEDGVVYLELFNTTDFSGKYKRVSQPRKIAMRPLDTSVYAENIVGKWKPLDGQEFNLELTKYGAAIQTKYGADMRYDYSLNGKKLSIGYDSSATVDISEDASYYYLEIYNSEDFSGRYRKSK